MARIRRIAVRASLFALLFVASCIFRRTEVRTLPTDQSTQTTVESVLRVFLVDGSVALFRGGGQVGPDAIVGPGVRFPFDIADSFAVNGVQMDSVVGIEAYESHVNATTSTLVSLLATGVTVVAVAATAKALFGSCPTIYMDPGPNAVLESEAFSYSIAPLLEGRDVDLLRARPNQGSVSLELRNEALETHYINQLGVEVVDHAPGTVVVPTPGGQALVFSDLVPVQSAAAAGGIDPGGALAERDDRHYRTPETRIQTVTPQDFLDRIHLTLPAQGQDSVALVITARNSLLNTVLFYDFMLGRQGARALDWLARDVARIGTVAELGSWYRRVMGLRVEVMRDGQYVEVGRIPDTGPIAWKTVAVPIGTEGQDQLSVRLSFLADAWRIDQVQVGLGVAAAQSRSVPASRIELPEGWRQSSEEALADLQSPDEAYFTTLPGQVFRLDFDVGEAPPNTRRTLLLASQGYYTEWVRPDWIRAAEGQSGFHPSDALIPELMDRWLGVKDEFEGAFFASRIPVR